MRRHLRPLLPGLLAPLALLLTGCNGYQQDRVLNILNGSGWKPVTAPRQTWLPEGCVQMPARAGRHMISGRGPLLELRDAHGRRLAQLAPPMPLKGLYWFTLPEVVQLGHDSWLTGIPAHPGWDLVDQHRSRSTTTRRQPLDPSEDQQLLSYAEARLFHTQAFGPWKEVLRFRPDTGHGWLGTLIPLGNGTFLGVARETFRDQGHQSPLARFTSTPERRLAWAGLAALDGSGQPPATETGAWRDGSPLAQTCQALQGLRNLRWVARIPAGLLLAGSGSLLLLDPRDGHPSRQWDICQPEARIEACQPMPDGRVMLVVCGWGRRSLALERAQNSDAPSSRLLGPWVLNHHLDARGLPPAWGLILDPATGQLTPFTLPSLAGSDLFQVPLQVTPDGKPRILASPGDGKG